MAYGNKEIEIKTPISRSKYLRIWRILKKEAKFVKSSKQVDTYYSPQGKRFLKPRYPYEWLSLRERAGKITINYKHWYPEGKEVTTFCDEYESEVGDKIQLQKLLSALKFEKLVSVEKVRLIFVKNDLEIALDNVKHLGYFIEIESLKNTGGVKNTRKVLLDYARKLGVGDIVNVPGGYAAELMRKKKLLHS